MAIIKYNKKRQNETDFHIYSIAPPSILLPIAILNNGTERKRRRHRPVQQPLRYPACSDYHRDRSPRRRLRNLAGHGRDLESPVRPADRSGRQVTLQEQYQAIPRRKQASRGAGSRRRPRGRRTQVRAGSRWSGVHPCTCQGSPRPIPV
jgi:hypothetical protein